MDIEQHFGQYASTTGNVYGVYDMSGGAWERVAGYLDNKNGNLTTYGKSTSTSTTYFENNEIKSSYASYFDKYSVSDEERNNAIVVDGVGTLTQAQLWDTSKNTAVYNEARLRITLATYNKMAMQKGIGVNEVGGSFSFYGVNGTNNTFNWYVTVAQATAGTTTYGRGWNSDYTFIGHAFAPFVIRGGSCYVGMSAGVFCTVLTDGNANNNIGFRPALLP